MEASLHATGADANARTIRNTCPLEVWVYTTVTAWVELGGTNRVAVLSNNFRAFITKWTDFCHRSK
jgi:hypothetical protein